MVAHITNCILLPHQVKKDEAGGGGGGAGIASSLMYTRHQFLVIMSPVVTNSKWLSSVILQFPKRNTSTITESTTYSERTFQQERRCYSIMYSLYYISQCDFTDIFRFVEDVGSRGHDKDEV